MKLLCRDTSAFRFMMLGGLFSRKDMVSLPEPSIDISALKKKYQEEFPSFSVKEKFLEDFLLSLMKEELGWDRVQKKDDIWAFSEDASDQLMIECKKHDPKTFYLEEYSGGEKNETANEQVFRYFRQYGESQKFKWAVLTDGVNFRLYFNGEESIFSEIFLEINLSDIFNSEERCPYELLVLIDILSPNSTIRKIDPLNINGISKKSFSSIMGFLKKYPQNFRTLLKTLFVAAQEDMGLRPLHLGFHSIREAKSARNFNDIFENIDPEDIGFHSKSENINDATASEIRNLLNDKLADVDFYHIDQSFLGEIYQSFINNGNASHYTNSQMSKELAKYIVGLSDKSQKRENPVYLLENQYILDPALGSGQLLRSLLPYHKTIFAGRTSGISGWRRLASQFIGRDIDPEAIWIAKMNIWLSTSQLDQPLLKNIDFQPLNVIEATISRPAGESLKFALGIERNKSIAGVISNPPWDAFKNDERRGISFDPKEVSKLKESLNLKGRQLNQAQIFSKIILKLSQESGSMKFAVILPDSFFIDQNYSLRDDFSGKIDFYFSFPKNFDHTTGSRIFPSVDQTRKFGIIFGQGSASFSSINCFPLGNHEFVSLKNIDRNLITFSEGAGEDRVLVSAKVLPLYSDVLQQKIVINWMKFATRHITWKTGEFDQSEWSRRDGRVEAADGDFKVIGGGAFCSNHDSFGTFPVNNKRVWKRMSSVAPADLELRKKGRLIFSDYLNNSVKLNTSSFVRAIDKLNLTNKVLYSLEGSEKDRYIYDSLIFAVFLEIFGSSQNINGYRLSAIPIPEIEFADHLDANLRLVEMLGLSLREALTLYDLNSDWMSRDISKEEWLKAVAVQIPSMEELESLLLEIIEISKSSAKLRG